MVFYTVTVQRIVTAETPVYEGARIFQSDAYAVGGYLMQDRAVFYLLGFGTVLAITPILGLIKPLASLGQRTLPIYILHMPLYALLVQLGCYEACASHGLPAVITWLCFIIPAVVALCASAPVCHPERHCKYLVQNAPGSLFPAVDKAFADAFIQPQ